MSKLTIKKNPPKSGKEKAIEEIKNDGYFSTNDTKSERFDLNIEVATALKILSASVQKDDGKTVTKRDLITEFILDGFEKYRNEKGMFQIKRGSSFTWDD